MRPTSVTLHGKKTLLIVENNSVPFDKRVWKEAKALNAAGLKVAIICPKSMQDKESYKEVDGIKIFRYGIAFSSGSKLGFIREYLKAFFATFYLALKIYFTKFKFEVIHSANPPDIFFPVAFFFKIFSVKYIFDEHDLSPELYLSKFARSDKTNLIYKILISLQKLSYKSADFIISTNNSYRKITILRGRVDPDSIAVVRNGPDTTYFKRSKPNKKWRGSFRKIGVYIGIMATQDGVDYLIRACDYIVNELGRKDIGFILIGEGEKFMNLKGMTHELRLDKFIRFVGRVSDTVALEILSSSDIGVDPDPYNPLNNISTMNKIMEYMALKLPIVSFNLKEARFSAQQAALFVKNNDAISLAEGIVKLADNEKLSKRMAEFGYNRVEKKLSWQIQKKNLIKIYKELLVK